MKRSATIAVLAVLLIAAMLAPVAQAAADQYLLGSGDVVNITVFGDDNLTTTIPIGPDGIISIPLAGPITAAGRTTAQLKADIESALSAYIKSPSVNIVITAYRPARIVVLGEVARPGSYQLPMGSRIADAIGMAGGVIDHADCSAITVTAHNVTSNVDYAGIVSGRVQDEPLPDGAIVFIPRAVRQILVLGDVARPASYPVPVGTTMRLLDAVAVAGGVKGDPARATVSWSGTRDGVQASGKASLSQLLSDPADELNAELVSGDAVFIAEAPQQASILGEVARPGVYPVRAGVTLFDMLAAAGGETLRADLSRVKIHSGGSAGSAGSPQEANIAFEGDIAANPEIPAGALIVVPARIVRVQVVGYVGKPGQVELNRGANAVEAISAAGGIRPDGDGSRVTLTSADGKSRDVDIEGMLTAEAAMADAPIVADGDVIFVPEAARGQVLVMGEVARPGAYNLPRGARLYDAVAAAGGPTLKAAMDKVQVTEGGMADAVKFEGDASANPAVKPGDMIVIPNSHVQVTVLGRVARPGTYELRPGSSVRDAVAAAGGALQGIEDGIVALVRGADDTREFQLASVTAQDEALCAGDVVTIDEFRPQAAAVGEFARPGLYHMKPSATLLDLLAEAGGLKADADGSNAVLTMADGSSRIVDLAALVKGSAGKAPLVADGATLFVPRAVRQVAVTGEVMRPGLYNVEAGANLADLIAQAGGLTPQAAQIKIFRRGDMSTPFFEGDLKANPVLNSGDVVTVESGAIRVTVLGKVSHPGTYELLREADIRSALAAAGGLAQAANASQAVLTRGDTVSTLDLDSILRGGPAQAVQDGDVLFVPELRASATAMGEVARPGIYHLEPGATVLDLLAAAGGATREADLAKAVLATDDGSMVVDLDAIVQGKVAPRVLGEGDSLFVPRLYKPVSVLGLVARPGSYSLPYGAHLSDAIAAAGGLLDGARGSTIKIHSDASADGAAATVDIADDPELPSGAVIVIAGGQIRAYVAGEVARPGQVALKAGATVLDAIAASGGLRPDADGSSVSLVRRTGEGTTVTSVDIRSALEGKGGAAAQLADGDAIFVEQSDSPTVLVMGEVARPGSYRLTKDARLLDAIALAGGLTPRALAQKVSVFPAGVLENPKYISIGNGKDVNSGENPLISRGDVIVVASRMISVSVIGNVARPGVYELTPDMNLSQALAMAGGITAAGNASQVSIANRDQARVVDADGTGRDAALADGDVIHVPESTGQVTVFGEVARPGAYKLPRGARLLDAIAAAGGANLKASLEDVTVYRDGALAAGSNEPIGTGAVLFSGRITENPSINPGDVVRVGSRMITVSVIGKAARPGAYEVPAGARVIDAIAAAGGIAPDGDRHNILVVPAGEVGPGRKVDLDSAIANPSSAGELVGGDVVYIPEQRQQLAVLGEVARPGVYAYSPGMTVMEALAQAGGSTVKADLDRVRLYRGGASGDAMRLEIADDRLAFEGGIKSNPVLESGDILFIPSGRIRVQIAGHVVRSGEVELRANATVLDAISAVGGLNAAGDGSRVVITRKGEAVREVDVDALLASGGEAPVLTEGDVIFVPEARRKIVVMGAVARPGLYDYKHGMSLIEALAQAGGPSIDAKLDKVLVYSGEQAAQIALGSASAKGITLDPSKGNNPELKSGDIVIVPQSDKIDWAMISAILTAANQIKNLIKW